jgi:hypothetical protein
MHKGFWDRFWLLTHNERQLVGHVSLIHNLNSGDKENVPGGSEKLDLSLCTFITSSSILFLALTDTPGLQDIANAGGLKNISSGITMSAPAPWRSEKETNPFHTPHLNRG